MQPNFEDKGNIINFVHILCSINKCWSDYAPSIKAILNGDQFIPKKKMDTLYQNQFAGAQFSKNFCK